MKALTTDYTAANIIPDAAAYSGGGSYTLTTVVGKTYLWTKGASDTSVVVNGSITLTATGVFTATAASVTLHGTVSVAITALVSEIAGHLYPTTFTPALPARLTTVGEFPSGNPNWSRQHQVSDEAHYVKRGTAACAILLPDFTNLALTQDTGLTWTPPVISGQPESTTVAHTAQATFEVTAGSEYNLTYAWYELSLVTKTAATLSWNVTALAYASGTATATLTSTNVNVSDGDTVKIAEKVYTFKTALTPTEGQVLIGADADASLLNLIRAINHTGTPDTDYKCAAAHPTVTAAASVTAHAFAVTAKALTTTGIYDVATAGTLKVTPTDTSLNGTVYYVTVTDDAGSYVDADGDPLTNGSVTTDQTAILTVT